MSRDQWFEKFERIQAERPELSDEDASELAYQQQREDFGEKADRLKDERKYGPNG